MPSTMQMGQSTETLRWTEGGSNGRARGGGGKREEAGSFESDHHMGGNWVLELEAHSLDQFLVVSLKGAHTSLLVFYLLLPPTNPHTACSALQPHHHLHILCPPGQGQACQGPSSCPSWDPALFSLGGYHSGLLALNPTLGNRWALEVLAVLSWAS